ncbi:GGDEF domain-containing protein [Colwellia psychrerythraea]|uniref:diguanylate cyclase n=1 Tax=Colwellia psychrerythraea TaxID=28229 RepID=A0A099KHF1_COLPS|nr:GGDEF domain-containing protein [Colwellia psychrerythraea]KGJ89038.1 diguanylate cyclase and serine/threonine protein kinase with TPR repeat [Colwellia psychrerythraea]
MSSFAKKISQSIQVVISIFCLLLAVSSTAQEKVDLKSFNQVAEQVIELKKTDLVLSLKKLAVYQDLLNALSVEQNLVYFKLLAEIQIEQNKYSTAKVTANRGLTIAKRLASPSIRISELLYLKGYALEFLGDTSQAEKEYKKGLEVAESLHHKVQIAYGLLNLGAISYLTDDYERSLVLLNDAFNIAGQTHDEKLKAEANTELGIVYSHLLQDDQSMEYYQQAYLHYKKAGMLIAAQTTLVNIANMHIYNKSYQQAITVFKTVIAESNKDSPVDSMYGAYSGMAWAHLQKEDSNADAAYEYLLMAKQYLVFTENLIVQLQYYIDEAYILYKLDRYDDALVSIAQVEKMLANHQELSLNKKRSYVSIIDLKSAVYYKKEQFEKAYLTKSRVITLTDKLHVNEDNRSIAKVRLRLEGEQADKKNKLLQNKHDLYESNLREANLENEQQRLYLIISALVALAFAWVLIKLLQSQHKLKVASNVDALTGVANRRSLMRKAEQEFKYARRKQIDFSVLMIDIDHFKKINDSLGHNIGDKVLAEIATIIAEIMRKSDIYGRFGGEQFMVCLSKTTMESALDISERIRLCVCQHSWRFDNLERACVSIGVASLTTDKDFLNLIKRADDQLYQAKASGRNKVCG